MSEHYGSMHVDDADFIRLLDGEGVDAQVEAHLASCGQCQERYRLAEGRTRRLVALLAVEAKAVATPSFEASFMRRRTKRRAAVAIRWAAAAALAGVLLFNAPARAWLTDHLATAWAWVGGSSPEVASPFSTPPEDPTEVESTVTGPLLTIRTGMSSAPRTVVFRAGAGARARARLVGVGSAGEILVRADGFDVRVRRPGGQLEVWVPATVREVRVLVDGEERVKRAFMGPGGSASEPWRVELW